MNWLTLGYNCIILTVLVCNFFTKKHHLEHYVPIFFMTFCISILMFPCAISAYFGGLINEENRKQRIALLKNSANILISEKLSSKSAKSMDTYVKAMKEEPQETFPIPIVNIPLSSAKSVFGYLVAIIIAIYPDIIKLPFK